MADNGKIDELQIQISVTSDKAVSSLQRLAKEMRTTADSADKSASKLSKFVNSIKGISNKSQGISKAAKEADDTLVDTGKAAENAGKSFDRAANGGLTNFLKMVKRVAMMRSIRSAIRFLAQAVKEGFEMFVTWDREQNNYMAGTAANVEKLSEKWTILKGQIGALGGALANTFIPIITWIIDGLTKLVDILQMVIRSLQGEYSYYKLIYHEAKATTGQAKELKRILFGFDELNILPSQSGGGLSSSGGNWAYEKVGIDNKFLNSIADASNKLKELFGISDEGQKILGGLGGVIALIAGAKGFGLLLGLLPRLIGLFKGKNKVLGDQTTQTQAEGQAVESLAYGYERGTAKGGAFQGQLLTIASALGLGIAAHEAFTKQVNNTPATISVGTAVDLSGFGQVATGLAATQSVLNANPLTIALYAPLAAMAQAFVTFRDTLQRLFNNNPVNIAMRVAGGGLTGAGGYVKSLSVANASVGGKGSTVKDVEKQIQDTMLQYESDLWNKGGTLGKAVAVFGGSALITAISGGLASLFTSGSTIGQLLNLLGLAGSFADGGVVPNTGSLFYAGEAGAEVVANMGHSTGVMNVSQMQEAVASGNVEVVNAVYAMANMVVNAVNNKNLDVYMDTQKVGQSVSRYQYNQSRRGVPQGAY